MQLFYPNYIKHTAYKRFIFDNKTIIDLKHADQHASLIVTSYSWLILCPMLNKKRFNLLIIIVTIIWVLNALGLFID
jgi:hypothetical protein